MKGLKVAPPADSQLCNIQEGHPFLTVTGDQFLPSSYKKNLCQNNWHENLMNMYVIYTGLFCNKMQTKYEDKKDTAQAVSAHNTA